MGQFDATVGVLLLGLLVNTYLYGLVTYQFIVYHISGFKDPIWLRALVGTLFVVDTTHSMVAVYAGWQMCIVNFARPESLAVINWTIPFTAIATSIAAILTQIFLGHRVFMLTRNWVYPAMIATLSGVGLVFGIYSGIRSGIVNHVENFTNLTPFVIVWLGFQTCTDLFITSILSWKLIQSRTSFKSTNTVINRLIRGTVQTGLFASLFALGDLFSFVLHRDTNLYAMFAYPLGRIYTNTLLDTLNSRLELKVMSANHGHDFQDTRTD